MDYTGPFRYQAGRQAVYSLGFAAAAVIINMLARRDLVVTVLETVLGDPKCNAVPSSSTVAGGA